MAYSSQPATVDQNWKTFGIYIQKMLSIANQKNVVEPLHNGQRGLNTNQGMDCLPKKVAIVERWPL